MAEYAKAKGLEEEPPFVWWVGSVLRRRDRILKSTNQNKYWMGTHKYGVELPHTIKEALAIDRKKQYNLLTTSNFKGNEKQYGCF